MKKIALSVSVCTLALMAGCTKENINQQVMPEGSEISFIGTMADPSTRLELGVYDPDATSVPVYWTADDGCMIAAYDKEGNLLQYIPRPAYPDYKADCLGRYSATTETPSVTTGFMYNGQKFQIPEDVQEANIFAYSHQDVPYGTYGINFKALQNPIVREQKYDVLAGKAANNMFLTATAPYAAGDELIELQFSNAFTTMMIGVKGDAKIDSVKVSNEYGYFMTYGSDVTVDVTNAPAPGRRDTHLLTSYGGKFLNDGTEDAPIAGYDNAVLKLTRQMQLNAEVKWLPVMIMPISGITGMSFSFTVYATDKDGATSSIERTVAIPASVDELTTNSIVYVKLKDIAATELNQNPPRSDWQAGEVVKEDNFSWVTTDWNAETYDIYGWTDPYNNSFFPKYNHISAYEILNQKGYIVPESEYNIEMLYSYDGMLQIGGDYSGSRLMVPMGDLFSYTGTVAVTFRAAPFANKYGELLGNIQMSATDGGNILREVIIENTDATEPFTWYDYTVLIENVTSNTNIVFGSPETYFFLESFKVSIADGETENLAGTKVDRPAPAAMFLEPANGSTIEIPAVQDVLGINDNEAMALLPNFRFAINGPWELVIPEGNDWMKISKVDWSDWEEPYDNTIDRHDDKYGNEMTSIFYIQAMEDNDSGADRNVDVQLKSGDEVLATYTITQPKAGVRTDLYGADFGDHAEPVFASNTLTQLDWGVGSYSLDLLNIAYNADNVNPGLELNNTAKSKDYEGASGLGNLLFANSFPPATTGGGEDPGVDPLAEGDPDPVFAMDFEITNGSYLYVNYGAWAKAAWDVGKFVVEVVYDGDPASTQQLETYFTAGTTWKYYPNRLAIPDGATTCTLRFYAQDAKAYNGTIQSAAGAYRIDDLTVAYRQK